MLERNPYGIRPGADPMDEDGVPVTYDDERVREEVWEGEAISTFGRRQAEPDYGPHPKRDRVRTAADASEDAIALAFTERFYASARFCHDTGAWFLWNGSRWVKDTRKIAFHYARDLAREIGGGEAKFSRASVADGAERFARSDPAHAVDASVWDRDAWSLATPGGTVNLRTGKLSEADPADFITKLAGATPAEGEPVLWLKFLREAMRGDEQMVQYFQRVAGYCLTGVTREHALFFGYGPGGNGKSVALNTLSHIMGDYAAVAMMDLFVKREGDGHTAKLAALAGARLVTASETDEGKPWDEPKIKQLTGGDPVTARWMRGNPFTFTPQFKLVIAGNHPPVLRNVDDAMRRRFNILPFTNKPARPDRQLEEKLRAEAGQILSWAIAGCIAWQRDGLGRPDGVTQATADYFAEQDVFGQWIEERCELRQGSYEPLSLLFADWSAFATEAKEEPGSKKSMGARLARFGVTPFRTTAERRYLNIRLRTQATGERQARREWAERAAGERHDA